MTGGDSGAELKATGEGLRRYLEETAQSRDSVSAVTNEMGRLLADRIDESSKGMNPMAYVLATQILRRDCEQTGVDAKTGEPMPREVMNQPPLMYVEFQNASVEMARGAFGEAFAGEVSQIYDRMGGQA